MPDPNVATPSADSTPAAFVVRDLGSFFAGGASVQLRGHPVEEITVAAGAAPMKIDPNGTYPTGQTYVQYVRLAAPQHPVPVLFLNGGTFTGAQWETTPDGRPGWQTLFLRAGYDTYLTDAVNKGRASWSRFPEITPVRPTFRPMEATWTLLRIGPPGGADREAFAGTQFPVDAFDTFVKQNVPRFAGQDALELSAYQAAVAAIGPCIVVAQSSGAYFATRLAQLCPGQIKAIVAAEMTAFPNPETDAPDATAALVCVPQLLLWGDNWHGQPMWSRTRAAQDAYLTAINQRGGRVELMDLPERGLAGNSHQLMADRNNGLVADIVLDWLRGLTL